jgi:Poly(A) polymerase catalytic subunit
MENTFVNHISSLEHFSKKDFDKQIKLIKQASEVAQSKINYASAHDDHIIHAIEIIENFLRKKHRICYGGQAINAHLPNKYKFYDPEYSIPDYDFFSPDQDNDIRIIVKDLRKAGFEEISAREGMHEGTVKIYVDYIPVADITEIHPSLYRILSKREYRIDGISYMDANTLRMLMYLELSRPRGEVDRWPKVYERLLLFNEFASKKPCQTRKNSFKSPLEENEVEFIIEFIVNQKRIFAGADLVEFYRQTLKSKKKNLDWIIRSHKPILFYSSEPEKDAKEIVAELHFRNKIKETETDQKNKPYKIKVHSSKGAEILPGLHVITRGKDQLIFIVHQTACHSYFNVPIHSLQNHSEEVLRIASMDTLITLYFSLGLIQSRWLNMGSMECLANQLVQLNTKARKHANEYIFPFISILCSGHQTSLPSLIRSKVQRITSKRNQLKQLLEPSTYNRKKNKKHNTFKNMLKKLK